jgi:hypothetical protein
VGRSLWEMVMGPIENMKVHGSPRPIVFVDGLNHDALSLTWELVAKRSI